VLNFHADDMGIELFDALARGITFAARFVVLREHPFILSASGLKLTFELGALSAGLGEEDLQLLARVLRVLELSVQGERLGTLVGDLAQVLSFHASDTSFELVDVLARVREHPFILSASVLKLRPQLGALGLRLVSFLAGDGFETLETFARVLCVDAPVPLVLELDFAARVHGLHAGNLSFELHVLGERLGEHCAQLFDFPACLVSFAARFVALRIGNLGRGHGSPRRVQRGDLASRQDTGA